MQMESKDKLAMLNGRYAYIYKNGGSPIYSVEQMLPDKPLACQFSETEWQERNSTLTSLAVYKDIENSMPYEMALIKRLLSFGGYKAFVQRHDKDSKNILERGQFWYSDHTTFMKGTPCQCHKNTCDLWEQNYKDHEVAIATGYALIKDGTWFCHSWLMQRRARSVQVIETTMKRIAYFGFVMTEKEAKQFCSDNF